VTQMEKKVIRLINEFKKNCQKLWFSRQYHNIFWLDFNRTIGIDSQGFIVIDISKNRKNSNITILNAANRTKHHFSFHIVQNLAYFRDPLKIPSEFEQEEWSYHNIYKCVHRFLLLLRPAIMMDVNDILYCRNTEIRRRLIEHYGWDQFLENSDTILIDQDGDMQLYRVNFPEGIIPRTTGRIWWWITDSPDCIHVLKVKDGSSEKYYYLEVPPREITCRSAVAWTFGLTETEYKPLQET
jgi:hypothetical protein